MVAALLCALTTLPARAADAEKVAARAHFEAASRLYDIKEFAKALDEYKAAYLAKPDPAFLFNIGQCYKRLGKPVEALEFYREYLRKAPPDDPNRPNVEARVREMESGDLSETGAPTPSTPAAVQPRPAAIPESRSREVGSETAPAAGPPPPNAADGRTAFFAAAQPPPPAAASPPAPALDLTATQPSEPTQTGRPFYRTWWFWTGVGAAVVAATVVAIVVANSGGKHTNTADTGLGTQGVLP